MFAIRAARAFTGRPLDRQVRAGRTTARTTRRSPGRPACPQAMSGLVVELPWGDPDKVERALRGRERDLAAIIIEPVQGAGGIRAAGADFLALPARRSPTGPARCSSSTRSSRSAWRRRRAGALRRAPGPDDARQDHRRRLPARGLRRPGGRHGASSMLAARRAVARRHVQRQSRRGRGRAGHAPAPDARSPTPTSIDAGNGCVRASPGHRPAPASTPGSAPSRPSSRSGRANAFGVATGLDRSPALFIGLLLDGFYLAPRGMGAIPTVATEADVDDLADAIVGQLAACQSVAAG